MATLASKVLDTIQQQPGIRTIEICDKVDCEIDLVESVLQALLAEEKLTVREGLGPNGRKARFFEVKGAGAAPVSASEAAPDAAEASAPATNVPKKSKVDLAIDFVRAHGPATTAQLRIAMALEPHHHPQAFLSWAVNNRRLCRTPDKRWILGENIDQVKSAAKPAPKPLQRVASVAQPARAASAPAGNAPTQDLVPVPALPIPAESDRPTDDSAAKFVAGLFTDGDLHLRIGGNWIQLSADETNTLRQLLRGAVA